MFKGSLYIILSGVRWQRCLVYLYYVIIFFTSVEEKFFHGDEVLSLLGAAGLFLKQTKFSSFKGRFDYFGHVFLPGKLADSYQASEAVRRVPFPTDNKKARILSLDVQCLPTVRVKII